MADENEPRGWEFDEDPQDNSQNESEKNEQDSSEQPQQPPQQPPVGPSQQQPPQQPPVDPQQPSQPTGQQPKYVQQPGSEQAPQEVHSIFDVAGSKSPSDKPEPEIPPEVEAELKKQKRDQQIKVAIRGIIGFAGILALIYAGMFVYRLVTNVTPGSETPEAVIESTFLALEEKDVLGILRQLDPEETEPLLENRDLFSQYFQENEEIANADRPLIGFNISISGLETETTLITEDLARVEMTKGTISADVDETQLPRNSSLEGDELSNIEIEDLNEDWKQGNFNRLGGKNFDEENLESEHIFYVAIKREGRWYFSSTYTAAEYLRIAANANGWDIGEPTFDSSVMVARGGSSPEEAVRNFINSTLELDSQPTIDMFSTRLFPPIFEYRDVIQRAEDFNEDNLYFRAVRQGVEMTDLNMTVRDYDPDDTTNPYRFVAINSLFLDIDYDLEVTTSDLENFGFVPFAARLLVNWDGECINTEGAYAIFESEEVENESPEFPIVDSSDVEYTAEELDENPELSSEIVFPVIDAQENVFSDVESFNGGTSTNYTPITKEIDDRKCYRENSSDFPEVGLMTIQEGSNYYISPIDTVWHFASWIITGNHIFEK